MKKLNVYKTVLRDAVSSQMDQTDVLLHMVVLHTHSIVVSPTVPVDDVRPETPGGQIVLAPLTRNHVAEVTAALFAPGKERRAPSFWYWSFCQTTPYEVFDDVLVAHRLDDQPLAVWCNVDNTSLADKLCAAVDLHATRTTDRSSARTSHCESAVFLLSNLDQRVQNC